MADEISPADVRDLLEADDPDVRVVDIRTPAAFERGHVPGSENIPFQRLPDEVDRLDGAERVVTVCPHGKASLQAADLIRSYEGVDADADVASMAGGLDAWEWDLESEDAEEAAAEGPESPF